MSAWPAPQAWRQGAPCPECGLALWQPIDRDAICVNPDCNGIRKLYQPETWLRWVSWRDRDFGLKLGRLTLYANLPLWRPSYGLGLAWVGFTWNGGGGHELALAWPPVRIYPDPPGTPPPPRALAWRTRFLR